MVRNKVAGRGSGVLEGRETGAALRSSSSGGGGGGGGGVVVVTYATYEGLVPKKVGQKGLLRTGSMTKGRDRFSCVGSLRLNFECHLES